MSEERLRLVRRRIGFIWQEYNLVDRLPVIMNVLVGRLGYDGGLKSLLGYLADRVLVMRNGAVVERGLTDHVLDDPQDAYTQQLVHANL